MTGLKFDELWKQTDPNAVQPPTAQPADATDTVPSFDQLWADTEPSQVSEDFAAVKRGVVGGVKEFLPNIGRTVKEAAHGVAELARGTVPTPGSPEQAQHLKEAARIGINFAKWPLDVLEDVVRTVAGIPEGASLYSAGTVTDEQRRAQLENLGGDLVGLVGFKGIEAGLGGIKAARVRKLAQEEYYRSRGTQYAEPIKREPIPPERRLGPGPAPAPEIKGGEPEPLPPEEIVGGEPEPIPTLAQLAKRTIDEMTAAEGTKGKAAVKTSYHRWQGASPQMRTMMFPQLAQAANKPWKDLTQAQKKIVRATVEAEEATAVPTVSPVEAGKGVPLQGVVPAKAPPPTAAAKAAARPPIPSLTPEQIAKFGQEAPTTPGVPRPSELERQLPPEHQTGRGLIGYEGPPRGPPPPSGIKPTGVEEIGRGKLTQAEFEAANEAQRQKMMARPAVTHGTSVGSAVSILKEGLRKGSSIDVGSGLSEGEPVIFEMESKGTKPYFRMSGEDPGSHTTTRKAVVKRVFFDADAYDDPADARSDLVKLRKGLDESGHTTMKIERVKYNDATDTYEYGGEVEISKAERNLTRMPQKILEQEFERAMDNLDASPTEENRAKLDAIEAELTRRTPAEPPDVVPEQRMIDLRDAKAGEELGISLAEYANASPAERNRLKLKEENSIVLYERTAKWLARDVGQPRLRGELIGKTITEARAWLKTKLTPEQYRAGVDENPNSSIGPDPLVVSPGVEAIDRPSLVDEVALSEQRLDAFAQKMAGKYGDEYYDLVLDNEVPTDAKLNRRERSRLELLHNDVESKTRTAEGAGETDVRGSGLMRSMPEEYTSPPAQPPKLPGSEMARRKTEAEKTSDKIKTYRKVLADIERQQVQEAVDLVVGAPPITNTLLNVRVYDTQGGYEDLAKEAAESSHAGPLVEHFADVLSQVADLIQESAAQIATNIGVEYNRFKFGGLSVSPNYLGINLSVNDLITRAAKNRVKLKIAPNNIIAVNPYTIFDEIRKASRYDTSNAPLEIRLSQHTMGTLIHEVIHESIEAHDTDFSGEITRALGVVHFPSGKILLPQEVLGLYETLVKGWSVALDKDFIEFYEKLKGTWDYAKDIFGSAARTEPIRFFTNDIGYFGGPGKFGPLGRPESPLGSQLATHGGGPEGGPPRRLREGETSSERPSEGTALRGPPEAGSPAAARAAELQQQLESTTDVVEKIQILNELRNISEGIFVPPKVPEPGFEPAPSAMRERLGKGIPTPSPTAAPTPAPVEAPEPTPPRAPESQLALVDSRGPLHVKTLAELDAIIDQLDNLRNPDQRALGDDYLRVSAAKRIARAREMTGVVPPTPQSPVYPELDVPEQLLRQEQEFAKTIAGTEGPMIRGKINRALRFQKPLHLFDNDKLGYHLNELKGMLEYAARQEKPKIVDRINAVIKEQAARAKGDVTNVPIANVQRFGNQSGFIKVAPDPLEETRIPGQLSPAEERILDTIEVNDPATDLPSMKQMWNRARFHTERFILPVELAEQRLLQGKTIPKFHMPGPWMEMYSGWSVRAEQMLIDTPMRWGPDGNLVFNPEVRGYARILHDVRGRLNLLRAYEVAIRTLEKAKVGLASGADVADATKVIENGAPDIVRAAHESVMFRHAVLQYGIDAGGISPKALQLAIDLNQSMIPLYHILEGKPVSDKVLKARDPIKVTVDFVRRTVRMADRNMIFRRLIELAESNPDMAQGMIEKVETPKGAVTEPKKAKIIEELKKAAKKEGITYTDDAIKELVDNLTAPGLSRHNNKITFYRNGVKESWRVDEDIAASLEALTPVQIHWLAQLVAVPARTARAGIVYSPLFPPLAAIKDALDSRMRSEYGFTPWDSVLGFGHALTGTGVARILGVTPSEYHRLFKATGGAFAGLAAARVQTQQGAYRAVSPRALGGIGTIFHPIELVKGWAAPFDEAARVGELRKAKLQGASDFDAGLAGKRVGVDFNMHGATTQHFSAMTAFFNPFVQSVSADMRAARNHPRKVFWYGMALAGATAAIWALNKDDEEIQQQRKTPYGALWLWFRDPITHKVRKVPKPYFWGQVFMTGMEAALDRLEQDDPQAIADWVAAVRQQAEFSLIPSFGNYMRGVWQNQDPLTKSVIVPEEMKGILPQWQVKPTTSLAAKKAGEWFHISPLQVDYFIRTNLGTMGKDVNQAFTIALDTKNMAPEPVASELPFVGRIFTHYPSENTMSIQRFYEAAKVYETVNNTALFLAKNEPEQFEGFVNDHMLDIALAQMYAGGRQVMSDLRAAMASTMSLPPEMLSPHEKRIEKDNYTQSMIDLAKMINEETANLLQNKEPLSTFQNVSPLEQGEGVPLTGVAPGQPQ
jgi:hypothetical protein